MKRVVQVHEAGRLSPRPGSSEGADGQTVGGSQREKNPQLEVPSYSGTKAYKRRRAVRCLRARGVAGDHSSSSSGLGGAL